MKTETLHDLFVDQLHDLLSMETQLSDALPRLVKFCHDPQLQQTVREHGLETVLHRAVIVQILEDNGIAIENDECKAIAGLIEGGEKHLEGVDDPHTRDFMMIAHCLRIEHYEIAAYEITSRLGQYLGKHACAELLEQNLSEERATVCNLTDLEGPLLEGCRV